MGRYLVSGPLVLVLCLMGPFPALGAWGDGGEVVIRGGTIAWTVLDDRLLVQNNGAVTLRCGVNQTLVTQGQGDLLPPLLRRRGSLEEPRVLQRVYRVTDIDQDGYYCVPLDGLSRQALPVFQPRLPSP